MMRLVLDTSVIVAAFRSRQGASNALLDLLYKDRFIALASPALFLEYEAVLSRPEQRVAHLQDEDRLHLLLIDLAKRMTPVAIHYSYRPQLRDPSDEFVLDVAINGIADAIVTHNTRDFLPAADRFGVEVLPPGRILSERLRV